MSELKGMCPIIATPFTEKGAVDFDSFENLIRVLIQGGCHAVTLFGIAGEYRLLQTAFNTEAVQTMEKTLINEAVQAVTQAAEDTNPDAKA